MTDTKKSPDENEKGLEKAELSKKEKLENLLDELTSTGDIE